MLSLFEPGLGQIYNGQPRKGLIFLVLPLLVMPTIFLCINSNKILFFYITLCLLTTVYYIAAISDAIYTAKKFNAEYNLKKYNKIIVYLGIIILVFLVNTTTTNYFKKNYVQAYKIPAASNEPTLLIGDHILVDKRVSARRPERGDLIIFEFPNDPKKDYVKRAIAIGGDTVEIQDKVLLINHSRIKEPYAVHNDPTIFLANQSPRDNFGPVTVPENSCFVLGDNRDKSYDSRFWGFVENSKIKGTVKTIYWSWGQKGASVRWERIGAKVQ